MNEISLYNILHAPKKCINTEQDIRSINYICSIDVHRFCCSNDAK